ncbi:pyridoxamine 5'-phosphate oxidase family protein [Phycicoccus sp. M110.8]|uniref:pyridoxamine 5'-phosphate oxidase family protein n=1 Tax=Phycicoccus sp. M110.8 TaxID=3075433 RepID=UPI0028FD3294|nr:pyridoxamine 5'-phosphate oxidase family protein [Phycicoccus sp. M110.8]MDU0315406.1 pyridoxamine 5'-phosphate oxidase family protein [Phycicoccus sp. M110.8]
MPDHDTDHRPDDEGAAKVTELVRDVRIAMLTTVAPDGRLMSHPMATQDVDFDGTVRFVSERASHKVAHIEANPQVNVAYSSSGSWVSLSGTARIISDPALLAKYWDTFTDAWLEGGPENPNNIVIEVDATSAEYWDSPGGKVVQVLNLVKAKATGKRYEGDNERVDLP